jgi:hypothetical protein
VSWGPAARCSQECRTGLCIPGPPGSSLQQPRARHQLHLVLYLAQKARVLYLAQQASVL